MLSLIRTILLEVLEDFHLLLVQFLHNLNFYEVCSLYQMSMIDQFLRYHLNQFYILMIILDLNSYRNLNPPLIRGMKIQKQQLIITLTVIHFYMNLNFLHRYLHFLPKYCNYFLFHLKKTGLPNHIAGHLLSVLL